MSMFFPSAGHLTVRRVYLRVNEPMLFSAQSELGDAYFVSYADITDNGEMWMLTRVSEQRLSEFERGQIDIRDMFLGAEAGSVTLVEYDDEQPDHPILRYLLPTDKELGQYLAAEGRRFSAPTSDMIREIKEERSTVLAETGHSSKFIYQPHSISVEKPKDALEGRAFDVILRLNSQNKMSWHGTALTHPIVHFVQGKYSIGQVDGEEYKAAGEVANSNIDFGFLARAVKGKARYDR